VFPAHVENLETGFLTDALRGAGVLSASAVVGFQRETEGIAEALATEVVRLRLSYDRVEPDAPSTLIAKFASNHPTQRRFVTSLGCYEREVLFYRELADGVGLPTPRCYAAELDRDSSAFVLLLEDLAPAAPANLADGLRPEQVELAVRALAGFHATWWNSKNLEEYCFLRPSTAHGSALKELFLAGLAKCREDLEARSPHLARAAAVLADSMNNGTLGATEHPSTQTLVHGDFHVANLFFPNPSAIPAVGRRPLSRPAGRFSVVDWQTVHVAANGATDLARLLVSGLSIERRRAEQDRLLRIYHEALGERGIADYDMRELGAQYRLALFEQVLGQVVVTASMDKPSELLERQRMLIEAAIADTEIDRPGDSN
jgi:aminoglycoside phosphotransferase (APT) family kinase protein